MTTPSTDGGGGGQRKLLTRSLSLQQNPANCYPIDVYLPNRRERVCILPVVDMRGCIVVGMNIACNLLRDGATSFHHESFIDTPAAQAKCDELDAFQFMLHVYKHGFGEASMGADKRPYLVHTHTLIEKTNGDDGYHLLIAYIHNRAFEPMEAFRKRMIENDRREKQNDPSAMSTQDDSGSGSGSSPFSFHAVYPGGGGGGGGGGGAAAAASSSGGGGGGGGGGGAPRRQPSRPYPTQSKHNAYVPFHLRMRSMRDFAIVAQLKNRQPYTTWLEFSSAWTSNNKEQNHLHPYAVFSLPWALDDMESVAPKYTSLAEYVTIAPCMPDAYHHPCPERAYWISNEQISVNEYFKYRLPRKQDNIAQMSNDMKIMRRPVLPPTNDEERGVADRRMATMEALMRCHDAKPHALLPKGVVLMEDQWNTIDAGDNFALFAPVVAARSRRQRQRSSPGDDGYDDSHMTDNNDDYDDGEFGDPGEEGESSHDANDNYYDDGDQEGGRYHHAEKTRQNAEDSSCNNNVEGREGGEGHDGGGGGGGGGSDGAKSMDIDPVGDMYTDGEDSDGLMHSCTTRGMPAQMNRYNVRVMHSIFACVKDVDIMRVLFPDLYALRMPEEDLELYFIIRGSVGIAPDEHAFEDDVDHAKRINRFHRDLNQQAIVAMQRDGRPAEYIQAEAFRMREEYETGAIERFKHVLWSSNTNASVYWRANVKFIKDMCTETGGRLFDDYRFTKLTSDCSLLGDYAHRFVLGREVVDSDSTCHKLQLKGWLIALSANDPNRKARIHYVAFGQHASSKSWLMDSIRYSCIPIVNQWSVSTLRANTESGNFDGAVCQQDEMNYAQAGVGKNGRAERGEEERTFKQVLSTCEVRVNETYFNEFHERKSRQGYRKCLETHMMNTNAPKRSMTPEFLDRCHAMLFMDYDRAGRNVPNLICSTRNPELTRMQEDSYRQKQLIHGLQYLLDMMITVDIFTEVQCTFTDTALPKVLVRAAEIGLPKTNAPRPIQRLRTAVRVLVKLRAIMTVFFSTMGGMQGKKFSLQMFRALQGHLADYDPSVFVLAVGMFQEWQDAIQSKVAQCIESMLTPELQQRTADQLTIKLNNSTKGTNHQMAGLADPSGATKLVADASSVSKMRENAGLGGIGGAAAAAAAAAANAPRVMSKADALLADSVRERMRAGTNTNHNNNNNANDASEGRRTKRVCFSITPRTVADDDEEAQAADEAEEKECMANAEEERKAYEERKLQDDNEVFNELPSTYAELHPAAAAATASSTPQAAEGRNAAVVADARTRELQSLAHARKQPMVSASEARGHFITETLEDAELSSVTDKLGDASLRQPEDDSEAEAQRLAQLMNVEFMQSIAGVIGKKTTRGGAAAAAAAASSSSAHRSVPPPRVPLEHALRHSPVLAQFAHDNADTADQHGMGNDNNNGDNNNVNGKEEEENYEIEDDDEDDDDVGDIEDIEEEEEEAAEAAAVEDVEQGDEGRIGTDEYDAGREGTNASIDGAGNMEIDGAPPSPSQQPQSTNEPKKQDARAAAKHKTTASTAATKKRRKAYKQPKDLTPYLYRPISANSESGASKYVNRQYVFFPTPGLLDDEELTYKKRAAFSRSICQSMHGNIRSEDVSDILSTWDKQQVVRAGTKKNDPMIMYVEGGIAVHVVLIKNCHSNSLASIVKEVLDGMRVLPSTFLFDIRMDANSPFIFSQIKVCGGSAYCPNSCIPTGEQIFNAVPPKYRGALVDRSSSININTNAFPQELINQTMSMSNPAKNFKPSEMWTNSQGTEIDMPYELYCFLQCLHTLNMDWKTAVSRNIYPEHIMRMKLVSHAQDAYYKKLETTAAMMQQQQQQQQQQPHPATTTTSAANDTLDPDAPMPTNVTIVLRNEQTNETERVRYMEPDPVLVQNLNENSLKPVAYGKIKAMVRGLEKEFVRLTNLRRRDQAIERKRLALERQNGTKSAVMSLTYDDVEKHARATAAASEHLRLSYLSKQVNDMMTRLGVPTNTMIRC